MIPFRNRLDIVFTLDLLLEGAQFLCDLLMESRLLIRILQIIIPLQNPQFKEESVLRRVNSLLKLFRTQILDKLIRILVGLQIEHPA